jgi:hypothetical protein
MENERPFGVIVKGDADHCLAGGSEIGQFSFAVPVAVAYRSGPTVENCKTPRRNAEGHDKGCSEVVSN